MLIQTASLSATVEPGGKVYLRIHTPEGAAVIDIDHAIWQGKEYTGVYVAKSAPKPKKVSAKRQKRASIAQEHDVMEALGGRRQAGSGAVGHLKGDGRVRDKYRVEIKYTRTKGYRVDRDELSKIRGECTGLEEPLFVIEFMDKETGGSGDRWVLVPFHHFKKLDSHAASHERGPEPTRGRTRPATRTSSKAR